ncbi:MAG: hypothetical protein HC852_14460 [Acaryochloridaceae cyanobacterium RU_4_10]|nr:hypothetical protein [Acaryochloridaceae cyanobacterium RU_4_10]
MVSRAQLSGLILATAVVSAGQPALAQYAPASDITISPGDTFSNPQPVVYGNGVNSFGGGAMGQVIQNGIPFAQSVLGGGGINSAIPGVLDLAQSYLPQNLQQYAGLLTPVLQGALSGSGVDLGGLVSSGLPLLTNALGLDGQTSGIIGSLTPALSGLLSGNFNAGSLISSGLGIASQFLGNNPVFGIASGVLGGLFGGGGRTGTGVDIAEDLSQLYSNPITAAINAQIFSGGGQGNSSSTVLAQTGTILCLYNSDCVQSNPAQYRSLYQSATGLMGYASSNQIRGQIAQFSEHGVTPDIFSSKLTHQQNAYYMGNLTDREVSRATTEQYLSKAGQLAQKKAVQIAQQTGKKLAALGDQCDKTAKSSQDLIRCNMKINTAVPSLQAAQLELQTNAQMDTQYMKNSLGNISSATDGLNRSQDVERSAYSATLYQNLALSTPIKGRK